MVFLVDISSQARCGWHAINKGPPMPSLTASILQRDPISSALAEAISAYSLVLLTAPMGYGKTTAARDLLKTLPHRVFTITASVGPQNALYWWDMACGQLAAQGSQIASVLQRMGFPANSVQLRRTLDQTREYLITHPTVLVIDDYHFTTAPEINTLLEALVRESIPNFCLMILSRTRPEIALEELRAKGLAICFDHSFLAFSKTETVQYFQQHSINDIESAEHAWTFTEGWPAALWLSLQSYHAHRVIAPTHDIEKLLSETVFSAYDSVEQTLLMQLSVLDSFTPQQAVAVSGNNDAHWYLKKLHDQNAFLRYDASEGSYRLHSIFRTYLRDLLPKDQGNAPEANPAAKAGTLKIPFVDMQALCRRAGESFAQNGDTVQAIRFFFQAGRDEDLLRILELFTIPGDGLVVMFDPEGLSAIMQNIPWHVRSLCPLGYLAFIYHYMSRVNLQAGLKLLKEATRHFIIEQNIPLAQQQRVRGEIELIRGIEEFNDLKAMRDRHEKAHDLLQGSSAISHPKLVWTFGSPHLAFLYLRKPGGYDSLVKLVEENLHYYQDMTQGCSAGAQDLFRAEYLLETGATYKIESHLMKAAYRAKSKEQLASLIAINFTQARVYLSEDKGDQAQSAIEQISPAVMQTGNPLLMNSLDLCRGYIASVLGRGEEIPNWLRQGETTACMFYQGVNFIHIVHGKALLAAGNWPCLEALGEDIPAQLGRYSNLFGKIHASLFRAIAAFHLHGQEQAMKHLFETVKLARPDGIMCSIAEYGSYIYPLLLDLREWYPKDTFIGVLSKSARRYARLSPTKSIQLAPREQAILERAIDGASYKVIAKALGITAASVGNTLSRVYAKLGVKNRAQATKKYTNRE